MLKVTGATVAILAAALISVPASAETSSEKLPGVSHFAEKFDKKSSPAADSLAAALKKGVQGGPGAETETAKASAKPSHAKKSADSKFGSIIDQEAQKHGVPASLVKAVIQVESSFRPDATGAAGEVGLMQIKPATAAMMGFKGKTKDLYDPATNIRFGVAYLAKAHKLGGGSTCGTILKYNAGHGAKKMNPVSKRYCQKVKRLLGA
ncbi:lytic transglycosylase domain-containing protein [Notoacmeibacter sp. MSK16QG-6]|uniref:lytic transglycosylase domain-containing protein n=1 Tax=Notoacmeibacter sp. MSK16QG-6 TaxID=2957982 RepID=UPI0020A0352C|nr:lytic transglycosylase domain-containing protein [Notoacmeibacter sp. MSK16QG-6]MCP1199712.1 lytic transglycosylase domain-containing protein [Notoacmeibacter sp. MSK16QG-6]